jgi:hypothetical protein
VIDDNIDQRSKNGYKNYLKHRNNSDSGNGNRASQLTGQSQSSSQNSQVVSGGDTIGSGNNINVQKPIKTGNNSGAQR